jgi:SagB-type dehydrogenase family enzyme
MNRHFVTTCLTALILFVVVGSAAAQQITLPPPKTDGGKPLMQVLNERHSTREFGAEKLSPQMLSNLLWAAFGVNRTDGKRTAPSAVNWQEMDIYVTLPEGAYVYDAKANRLNLVASEDLRAATGSQPFTGTAPLNLVYVADMTKAKTSPENQAIWVPADAGVIVQNVYLFCASEGLVAVVRGMIPRDALAKALKLRPEQKIMLAQTVGYPKK